MAVVANRMMRFHPYASKPTRFGSPKPATPLFNSTTLDSLSHLADVTPLMVSNISLSPIVPSGKSDIFRGEEVMSIDHRDSKRSKSFRKIKELCKLKPRRKIQMWRPTAETEVLESTRISDSSAMLDPAPAPLPVLPHADKWTSPKVVDQDQHNKGQLKVSIYINSGLLTIHVIQGRHFTSKWKSTCDSYIKVELIPGNNPGCQTDVILDTNHPMFDEKFSFELLPEDAKKRVLISVYHKTFKSRNNELIGCMSFGLQNITKNKAFVNGWYHLLPSRIGQRKHLQVSGRHLADEEQQRSLEENSGTSPVSYRTHSLLLRRGSSGYGFTVTGGGPAKVCRVDPTGSADVAGLRSGDIIMQINKEKVHTASTDGVARIIRHCTRKVLLDVQRPHKLGNSDFTPLPWKPAYNDLDSSMSSGSDDDDTDDDVPMATGRYKDNKENSHMECYLERTPAHKATDKVTFNRPAIHMPAKRRQAVHTPTTCTPLPHIPASCTPLQNTPTYLVPAKSSLQRRTTFRDFL